MLGSSLNSHYKCSVTRNFDISSAVSLNKLLKKSNCDLRRHDAHATSLWCHMWPPALGIPWCYNYIDTAVIWGQCIIHMWYFSHIYTPGYTMVRFFSNDNVVYRNTYVIQGVGDGGIHTPTLITDVYDLSILGFYHHQDLLGTFASAGLEWRVWFLCFIELIFM